MSTSDQEQKGINVRYHKRMAMGEKLNGQTQQASGAKTSGKPQGGLAQAKKK
jgi:hypothetical protein